MVKNTIRSIGLKDQLRHSLIDGTESKTDSKIYHTRDETQKNNNISSKHFCVSLVFQYIIIIQSETLYNWKLRKTVSCRKLPNSINFNWNAINFDLISMLILQVGAFFVAIHQISKIESTLPIICNCVIYLHQVFFLFSIFTEKKNNKFT